MSPHLPLPALAGLAVLLLAGPSPAQDLPRGQELFQQHCLACHHDFHKAEGRHLRSLDELRERVRSWASHTNAGWGAAEVNDVLLYLNASFYKFPNKLL